MHHLGISLPHEAGSSKVKNSYNECVYYSIFDGYTFNAEETWMNGDWFYTTKYGVFGH